MAGSALVIHLDTGFLIRALVPGSAERIAMEDWLPGGEPLQVSAVAWTELLCGPVLPARVEVAESLFGGPVALDGPEAAQAAKLRWKGELTCSPGETLVETGHRFRGGRGPALLVLAKGPAGLGEEARSAPPSTSMSSAGEMAVIPLPSGHCPLPPCTR